MSESAKAVFLSYASQDAEAAKRICKALRAVGIEVWFDVDGGLQHGDEWDAKIRRQIKDCVLFVPVISTHTQAREEGYFRIEWDLAAERARGIASGVAFILPVVIDETPEPDALVPDRFRSVQWIRLRDGVVPPEVQTRLAKLWLQRTGGPRHSDRRAAVPATAVRPASDAPAGKKPARVAAIVAGVGLLAVGLAGWQLWSSRTAAPVQGTTTAVTTPTRAEFPRDPELKHALRLLYQIDAIGDDFALAEDIAKPVIEARPNDPEVATVAAMISQEYLTRGFDTSEARRTRVQRLTERAVQLAPDEPDALAALSRYLVFMGMQIPRAEELIRRAIKIRPDEPRYHRVLLQVLNQSNPAEAEAFAAQMIARFPHDALAQYDVARGYKDRNDIPAMEKAMDATLAAGPVPNAMIWKSWLRLDVHGDLAGAKAWLDRVPQRQRANVRYANALSIYGIVSGDTEEAIRVLEYLPDAWLTDFDFHGPKAQLLGDLLRVAGRTDLARLQYEAALAEIQRAKVADATDLRLRYAELWTLLGLNRRGEARAVFKLLLESQTRPFRARTFNSWWGGLIRAGFLLGEREPPLTMLREAVVEPTIRESFRHQIGIDPAMAPWRDDPEMMAALAGPGQPTAPAGPGQTVVR